MDPRPCVTSIASHSSCRFRVTPSRPCRSEQNFENKQTNKTRVGMVDAGFAFSFLPPCARTRLACRALIGQQRSPAGRHGNGAAANRDAVNDGHLSLSACTRKPRRLHALRSVKDQRRPAPSSGGQTNYVDDNETRWTTPSARWSARSSGGPGLFFFSSSLTLGPIKSVSRLICLWISFLANLATLLLCYLRRVDALEESSELDRSLQNSSLKSIPLLISIEIQSFMPALIFVRHYGLT